MASTILAVGAAGKFAGSVIPALRKRGAQVRGMVHLGREPRSLRNYFGELIRGVARFGNG